MKFINVCLLSLFLLACSENNSDPVIEDNNLTSEDQAQSIDQASDISDIKQETVKFVKTTDNSEIKFPKEALEGTDAEKEFLATGKNIYVGDAEAIKIKHKTKLVISKLFNDPIISFGFVSILDNLSGSCFKKPSTPVTINKAKKENIIKFIIKLKLPFFNSLWFLT